MSVYSGFGTRQQESFYYKLLDKAIQLMSQRLLNFFQGDLMLDDKSWVKKMKKIYKYMHSLDSAKHMPPRFSQSMVALFTYLHENYETSSVLSKSPSSLMGANQNQNSQSALHIIQEEDGTVYDKSGNTPRVLENTQSNDYSDDPIFANKASKSGLEPSPEQTFFPQKLSVNNNNLRSLGECSNLTIVDPKIAAQPHAQFHSPRFFGERGDSFRGGGSLHSSQSTPHKMQRKSLENNSFNNELYKQMIQTYQTYSNANQPFKKQAKGASQRFQVSSNLDFSENNYHYQQPMSKQTSQQHLPSLKSTARVLSKKNLLDLMSGVSTSATPGGINDPYHTAYGPSIIENRYAKKKVHKGIVSSPTNYQIESILSRKQSQNDNTDEGISINKTRKLQKLEHITQDNDQSMIQGIPKNLQSHSTSLRRLPGLLNAPQNINNTQIIPLFDSKLSTQQLKKTSQTPIIEDELPQVIQVHSKHYHYNTNNIKIQMIKDQQQQQLNEANETNEVQQPSYSRSKMKKNIDLAHQIMQGLSSTSNLSRQSRNNNGSFALNTMQPKKILIVNPSQYSQQENTPRRQKKYFQLY